MADDMTATWKVYWWMKRAIYRGDIATGKLSVTSGIERVPLMRSVDRDRWGLLLLTVMYGSGVM